MWAARQEKMTSTHSAERVREGAEVSVTARLSVSTDRGMVVRLRGRVLRAEGKPGGAYGLAVQVEESNIL